MRLCVIARAMYSLPSPALLQRTRAYGTRFFHRFGM